jgi:hypothetical protein
LQEKVDKLPIGTEGMMIAEDLMEDQEVVQAAAVIVAVPAVEVHQVAVAAVHQMDEAQTVQMADLLHTVQEVDAVVLHQEEAAVLQAMAEVLQPTEDVVAEKVVLLQADEI